MSSSEVKKLQEELNKVESDIEDYTERLERLVVRSGELAREIAIAEDKQDNDKAEWHALIMKHFKNSAVHLPSHYDILSKGGMSSCSYYVRYLCNNYKVEMYISDRPDAFYPESFSISIDEKSLQLPPLFLLKACYEIFPNPNSSDSLNTTPLSNHTETCKKARTLFPDWQASYDFGLLVFKEWLRVLYKNERKGGLAKIWSQLEAECY